MLADFNSAEATPPTNLLFPQRFTLLVAVFDFAAEITEQTTEISEHLAPYIDYEKMARDMEMGGYIMTINDTHSGVYIFWSR